MSSQTVEPPHGAGGEILPEFLAVFEEFTNTVTLSEDAHDYIREFLAHGSDGVRERERVHGVLADEAYRDRATRVLVAAGNDLMERLGEYATTEITRDHLEAIFPEMCSTGYPPFCYGRGPTGDDVSGGTFSPGLGAEAHAGEYGRETELAGEPA